VVEQTITQYIISFQVSLGKRNLHSNSAFDHDLRPGAHCVALLNTYVGAASISTNLRGVMTRTPLSSPSASRS